MPKTTLVKAKEGVDYTLDKNGVINIKRGGRYLKKDGVLYINEQVTKTSESKKNEI